LGHYAGQPVLACSSSYLHMPIGKVWIYQLLFVCFYGHGFLRRG